MVSPAGRGPSRPMRVSPLPFPQKHSPMASCLQLCKDASSARVCPGWGSGPQIQFVFWTTQNEQLKLSGLPGNRHTFRELLKSCRLPLEMYPESDHSHDLHCYLPCPHHCHLWPGLLQDFLTSPYASLPVRQYSSQRWFYSQS